MILKTKKIGWIFCIILSLAMYSGVIEGNHDGIGVGKSDLLRKTQEKEEVKELNKEVNEDLKKGDTIDSSKVRENGRKTAWSWSASDGSSSSGMTPSFLADSGTTYDKWQQAYRLLGVYIDCDHPQSSNTWSYDNNPYYTEDYNQAYCARYYVWCAYVDPNYQGGGRSEYVEGGDGNLDCHYDDTEWVLLGCYRQEMYNTIEQLSKHIWSADDEDYETACAALSYMTKYDCQQVGYNNGNIVYAGVKPLEGGYFQMALYTDSNCLSEDTSGATYDDYYQNAAYDDANQGGSGGSHEDAYFAYYGDYTMEDVNAVMDGLKA